MFAVLETPAIPPSRGLFIRAGRHGHRIELRDRPSYVSVSVDLPVGIREHAARARLNRAMRAAARMGISGIVLPSSFPYPDIPGAHGLAVSSPVPLFRRLAGQLCRYAVESANIPWERVRLSFHSNRATPELNSAASLLSSHVKTFRVDAGADTDAVCYLLRSRHGISAACGAGRTPVKSGYVDIHILFELQNGTIPVSGGALVFNLTGGVPSVSGGRVIDGAKLEPPRVFWRDWPSDCDGAAMLAALLATEQLRLSDIGIRGLTSGGEPCFNK